MRARLAGTLTGVLLCVAGAVLLTGCGDKKAPTHPAAANCWAGFDNATPQSRHCDTDGMNLVDGVWTNPDTNKPINGS